MAGLLKTFRHYKSKVIVSTQWPNDLPLDARKQFDFFLLFKGHSKEKMKELFNDMGVAIPFEEMYKIYQQVTAKPYKFLYHQHTCEMRENFDKQILIS